ncbi:N-acetylmuramoyl-L-alanine amidase C-terminal domain-containing protein [Bacillus mycoides]|uniref:N-acetylmuramoyl-L-alanine amidase C-terminal domain-containing protein n=1 Tax=Bacillus mycoides TaxID=1405 RepID=UPI00292E32CE|nr:N-acetylmuramoyl-L-alanine amidase C-terminal domain-containing protein [Bacillus mycoides]WOA61003.1 N-acetylmuramoyl-L-alanine amidase C-terminal domain-containing protein [Bacillus mycoides]
MGKIAGSGGHNSIVQGANSVYGKEHVEDRKFLDAVAKYVQAAGWNYVNCSDEVGTTQTAVWSNAANNHLRVADSDVDLQFHLNASPGGTGCEVWLHPSYGNRELAAKISKAMADAFGLRDRGIKLTTDLGWINKTKTGLLPEICFIDNEMDMQKYRANFDKAAKAVAEVIVGRTIQGGGGNVNNGGYQYVKSGGFGVSLVPEVLNAMVERGTKGQVISDPSTGIAYLQTDVLPNGDLDKITAWMDTRPDGKWYYEYIKK